VIHLIISTLRMCGLSSKRGHMRTSGLSASEPSTTSSRRIQTRSRRAIVRLPPSGVKPLLAQGPAEEPTQWELTQMSDWMAAMYAGAVLLYGWLAATQRHDR
jgi:hypothetical protein